MLIVKLLTEHLRLNAVIHRHNWTPPEYAWAHSINGNCGRCFVPETVNHVLFACRRFRVEREWLVRQVRRVWPTFDRATHFNDRHLLYGYFLYRHERSPLAVPRALQLKLWTLLAQFIAKIKPRLRYVR